MIVRISRLQQVKGRDHGVVNAPRINVGHTLWLNAAEYVISSLVREGDFWLLGLDEVKPPVPKQVAP